MIRLVWGNGVKLLSIPIVKLGLAMMVVAPLAIAADAPVHDPFFDILGLILLNAIVTGAPEPDMWNTVSKGQFMYLWFYRSTHGFLGSATAYFSHRNVWPKISGPSVEQEATTESELMTLTRKSSYAEGVKEEQGKEKDSHL